MKISVVTPNFNYGQYLPKCLGSVFEQGSPESRVEIEHIVMDGGSTDDSRMILKAWSDSHPNTGTYRFLWKSEADKGQTDAINKGLRLATGDLVCWLNADEYYLPGKLGSVVLTFLKKPKTDLLYGEFLLVDGEGSPIRTVRHHWFSKFVLLYRGCYIPSCATFWKKELLDKDGFLDEGYKVVMDGEYWDRLAVHGRRFSFLPETIAAFSCHGTNVSSVFAERREFESSQNRLRYSRLLRDSPIPVRLFVFRILSPIALYWRRVLVVLRLIFLPRDSAT